MKKKYKKIICSFQNVYLGFIILEANEAASLLELFIRLPWCKWENALKFLRDN